MNLWNRIKWWIAGLRWRAFGTPIATPVKHVFVLMLENRSFDHMLGFSGITGTNAVTSQPTQINGLTGTESNSYKGETFNVTQPAAFVMTHDPGHEFLNVLTQLCGPEASYPRGGPYPLPNATGYVAAYKIGGGPDPRQVMECYSPSQLPVLTALAKEFVVCDNWFASMPGPTWPNRFFAHAASAGGLDDSPSPPQSALSAVGINGFKFENGTIFDRLSEKRLLWRIYHGNRFPLTDLVPQVAALEGISPFEAVSYSRFQADLSAPDYPYVYTFIEPSYGNLLDNSYKDGNSQHPLDDVTEGEALIKSTYEAIRNSTHWESSVLIVTWDEHGGFYDHVIPPGATPPGDKIITEDFNRHGFTFNQLGVRVPAVVISPLIERNLIDKRVYDHASIPATIAALFGLRPLTQRDAQASNLASLFTRTTARTDAPTSLPAPAQSAPAIQPLAAEVAVVGPVEWPINGNQAGCLRVALRQALAAAPDKSAEILGRFNQLRTGRDAWDFLEYVKQIVEERVPARRPIVAVDE